VYEGEVVANEFGEASEDSRVLLELVGEALGQMALFVEVRVIKSLVLMVRLGRFHRQGALRFDSFDKMITVVALCPPARSQDSRQ
jgi:hypothetical protein